MSFQVPRFLPSLTTGETTMTLPSGTQCCLCQLIPGSLPKTSDPMPIGSGICAKNIIPPFHQFASLPILVGVAVSFSTLMQL
jgi:hypothetical protein